MNWYSGDIGNAIVESKSKKLIFLVYAFDSNSTQMNELWNNNEAIGSLCNQNCVALKLEADSVPCKQFIQIYSVSEYPTTYLIGNNGRPLEIIVGNLSEEEVINKLKVAIETHNSINKQSEIQTNQVSSPTQSQQSSQSEQGAAAATVEEAENLPTSSEESQKSIEERVALAKEKLRLVQEKKRAEEEERERNSEMERRRLGQEILKAKREKEEQELRKIAEEKRREKQEDELAKQKILERIQQDREEKQKRYSKEKEELESVKKAEKEKLELAKQKEAQAEAARLSQIARIQFRFIDGSTCVNQFDPSQKLEDARSFVAQKLKDMNDTQSFSLHSTFPKREYTQTDMEQTLRELQLAPSATLLVIPIRSKASKALGKILPTSISSSSSPTSSSSSSTSIVSYANDFFSLLFLPFTIIYGIVSSLFGLNSNTNQTPNRQGNPSTSTSASASSSNANVRRRNINSLNNGNDDENATWNGNSTQQM